jgi:hypothetical protein
MEIVGWKSIGAPQALQGRDGMEKKEVKTQNKDQEGRTEHQHSVQMIKILKIQKNPF